MAADPVTPEKTGWPPVMLQDDCRALSVWLANRIDSRRHAREAAAAIAPYPVQFPPSKPGDDK